MGYCFPSSRPDFAGLWMAKENAFPEKLPETILSTLVVTTQLLRRSPVLAASMLVTVPKKLKSALSGLPGADAAPGLAEAPGIGWGLDG